jgi:hypothetical protein
LDRHRLARNDGRCSTQRLPCGRSGSTRQWHAAKVRAARLGRGRLSKSVDVTPRLPVGAPLQRGEPESTYGRQSEHEGGRRIQGATISNDPMCRSFAVNFSCDRIEFLVFGTASLKKFFVRLARFLVVGRQIYPRPVRVAEQLAPLMVGIATKQGVPVAHPCHRLFQGVLRTRA